MRSGSELPTIYIAVADKYGQIVGTDNTSKLIVSVIAPKNSDALKYPPSIEGEIEVYSK